MRPPMVEMETPSWARPVSASPMESGDHHPILITHPSTHPLLLDGSLENTLDINIYIRC